MLKTLLTRNFSKTKRLKKILTNVPQTSKPQPSKSKEPMIPQHPLNFQDRDPYLITPNLRYEYLSPRREIDVELISQKTAEPAEESHSNSRYSEISLIGPPNAGKSSLINKILEQKLKAVSDKTHTTNENSLAVQTFESEGIQLAFWDTPGLVARDKNSVLQTREAWKKVENSDIVQFFNKK